MNTNHAPAAEPMSRLYIPAQNVGRSVVIIAWYLIQWKGSTIVMDAGTNNAIHNLETLQAYENEKFGRDSSFDEDILQHVRSMHVKTKGSLNIVYQIGNKLYTTPCVTQLFELVPDKAKGAFPKSKQRDPVTCAQIQYVLVRNYPNKAFIKHIEQDTMQCKCKCENCFNLAFEEYYREGVLRCKK